MASESDRECQRALLGVVRHRLIEASREPGNLLDDSSRGQIEALVGSDTEPPAAPSSGRALLGHVLAEWNLDRDEVLILAAALAADVSPALLSALSLLGARADARALSVQAIAALLAPGEAGIERAHQILRQRSALADLALLSLESTDRPFPAQSISISPRLTELALGVRAPLQPLELFEQLPTPTTALDRVLNLRAALDQRRWAAALLAPATDVAGLAASLGPRPLLAVPLVHLETRGATADLCREARIFGAAIAVTVDRPLTSTTLDALLAISKRQSLVCVGSHSQLLARIPVAVRVDLSNAVAASTPPARTLATVAGPAAILPRSIDALNEGADRGSVLAIADPAEDGELPDEAETTIATAAEAWAVKSPGTMRVGIVGDTPPGVVARHLVRRAGLRPVLLPCAKLLEMTPEALERTWTDARNAASNGCGVVVLLDASTPRRVVVPSFIEGGLFILAGPHAALPIIEAVAEPVYQFGSASPIDELLAFAHGAQSKT